VESVLRETFSGVDGDDFDITRCGDGTLVLVTYDHTFNLTATEAARLRDFLNEALPATKADRVRACVQDFHDELAALQGCECARPDDADEPECDFTAEKIKALYDDMLADIRKHSDKDEPESDERAAGYIEGYRDAREDAGDCDCDCDDPDVDMVALRMWALEQANKHDLPGDLTEFANEIADFVLNGPPAD
jgi:hypothetical protein